MGKLSTKALDLLTKLLKMDPKERITGAQALNHPYFDDIRDASDSDDDLEEEEDLILDEDKLQGATHLPGTTS